MILRAHHMLCILGFRGRGYSKAFVENMYQVVQKLHSLPETVVEMRDTPDHICVRCPFISEAGCSEKGPGSEERARKRDHDVMEKLGLATGTTLVWSEVLQKIGNLISSEHIRGFCYDCEWLSFGFCIEGLESLKESKKEDSKQP